MPHSHFIHNLKIVFIFMPRPLKKRGGGAGLIVHGHKKTKLPNLFRHRSANKYLEASKLLLRGPVRKYFKLAGPTISVPAPQFSHCGLTDTTEDTGRNGCE